ncbi:hypothetical protein ABZ667_42670, partial [Streptomyces lavendulae]|uniref:hypothetical protein n=1 Tax=Streptomyces lavendulae TaxID=1914 RepID=UPI0034035562
VPDVTSRVPAGPRTGSVPDVTSRVPAGSRTGNLGEKYRKSFLGASVMNFTASAWMGWDLEKGNEWNLAAQIGSTTAVTMPVFEQVLKLAGEAGAADFIGGKVSPVVSALANLASLINNVSQAEKNPWAISFDAMGLLADALALAAIRYSAVAPIAGPAGVILAVPSMAYIIYNWGASLPMPAEFITEFADKAIASVRRSLSDARADHFQIQEAKGASEQNIAGGWNKIREESYKRIASSLQPPDVGKGYVSFGSSNSVKDELVYAMGTSGLVRDLPPLPRMLDSEHLRSLYTELGKYCLNKIKDSRLEDLDKLEFSLLEWLKLPAAKAWLTNTVLDGDSVPPKD